MSEEEILRYIFCCVSYKHMFDLSPQITESAKKKEFVFPINVYEYKGNINFELKSLKDGSVFYGGHYSGDIDKRT